MTPQAKKDKPLQPKFFHFEGVTPTQFHEADVIIFRGFGRPDVIMKDRFSTMLKKK